MTNEQAIKIRSCFANGVEFKNDCGIPDKYQELAELMDSAIKKQIPTKPAKCEYGNRFVGIYKCANCGGTFSGTRVAKYCYHCGQLLDWSDIENDRA